MSRVKKKLVASHIHKYERYKWGRRGAVIYRCVLGCPHYLHPPLMEGKPTICWSCGVTFKMHRVKAKYPKCPACNKGVVNVPERKDEVIQALEQETLAAEVEAKTPKPKPAPSLDGINLDSLLDGLNDFNPK